MDALVECLRGNFGYTAPATLLWRDAATARENLSRVLAPEGEQYDLVALVLEVLTEGGIHVTLTSIGRATAVVTQRSCRSDGLRTRLMQKPSCMQVPTEESVSSGQPVPPVTTPVRAVVFATSSGGDREHRDQQSERLPAFVAGSEKGDLPQLIVDPTARDQHRRRVRRAQTGTADALRPVLCDGARLDTVVAQKQQGIGLLLRVECVEPRDALLHRAEPLGKFVEHDVAFGHGCLPVDKRRFAAEL